MKVIHAFFLYLASFGVSSAEEFVEEYKITFKGPEGDRTAYLAKSEVAYTGTVQAFWGSGQIKTKYSLI